MKYDQNVRIHKWKTTKIENKKMEEGQNRKKHIGRQPNGMGFPNYGHCVTGIFSHKTVKRHIHHKINASVWNFYCKF